MQKTPLYSEHTDSGAKVVDFNGWALPVQFAGIVKEHLHTRAKASMFDCSHMGEYRIHGQDAIDRYDREIISDVDKIPVGRCRYGAVLSETGGILDDLITFRMAEEELYVVTNAGPLESVTARFCTDNPGAEHVSYETAKIDIQGPDARNVLLQAGFDPAKTLKYFNALWTEWKGEPILLSRTGYTGELGYELYMTNDLAPDMWKMFLAFEDVEPAGLGARDTLRLEVGYPLSGQDFDKEVTPLEAGMQPFIGWDTDFVGKAALVAQRERDDLPAFVGIQSSDRRAPRHGFDVYSGEDVVGTVTSGTFGPSLGHGIGLARVGQSHGAPGTKLTAGPKRMPIGTAAVPIYTDGTCRVKL